MRLRDCKQSRRLYGLIVFCLSGLLLFSVQVQADSDPMEIHKTTEKEISVRKRMQQREGKWAKKRQALTARYEALESERRALEAEKERLADKLALRRQKMDQLEQDLREASRVKKELRVTLEGIAGRLEEFVSNDLPFLESERSRRIKELKTSMLDPDVPLAEKTRKTLEALEVELDYGRRLEVTEESVRIDGREVAVDVLRVGRLSLFCRSPDGSTLGRYVPAKESWQPLAARHEASISKAMEIARQQRPADMIKLPLGRLEVQ
jgi:multidrug efflux pump subunit AcrA (membrane-fusion protein)